MESNKNISVNNYHGIKLNLDKENSLFTPDKPELKNALNLQVESFDGEGFWITNGLSNKLCFKFPEGYELCGKVKLDREQYVLCFKTPLSSEIGLFDSNTCTYSAWDNSACWKFDNNYWVNGVYQYNSVCESRTVYLQDGLNPDKIINIDIPSVKVITGYLTDACETPIYGTTIDCDKILANKKLTFPCVNLHQDTGLLPNGKYQIAIAYADQNQVISDYYICNEIILHNTINGLRVNISGLDKSYNYINAVVIHLSENGRVNYDLGFFTTKTDLIHVSDLKNKSVVSDATLFTINTHYVTSKHIAVVNNQLLKAGLSETKLLNYQKLANQITSKWVVHRVKSTEAYKHPCYMRGELGMFFIEWLGDDGKSYGSYHIPNNTPQTDATIKNTTAAVFSTTPGGAAQTIGNIIANPDVYEDTSPSCEASINFPNWKLYNTAIVTNDYTGSWSPAKSELDCEFLLKEGEFGYFESDLLYPDYQYHYNNADHYVYDTLACTPIRIHKFPDTGLVPHFYRQSHCSTTDYVDILGIKFANIQPPVDLSGVVIPYIKAYRIYRADTSGNETILSKGLLSNMLVDTTDGESVLFQNFPFNDLRPNPFLSNTLTGNDTGGNETNFSPLDNYSRRDFTYVSPDSSYTLPQKGVEIELEAEHDGDITAKLNETWHHPKHKILTNFSYLLSGIVGLAIGKYEFGAKTEITLTSKTPTRAAGTGIGSSLSAAGGFPLVAAALGVLPPPVILPIPGASVSVPGIGSTITFVGLMPGKVYTVKTVGTTSNVVGTVVSTNNLGTATLTLDSVINDPTVQYFAYTQENASAAGINPVGDPSNALSVTTYGGDETTTTIVPGISTHMKGPVNYLNRVMSTITFSLENIRKVFHTMQGFANWQQLAYQMDSLSVSYALPKGNAKITNKRRRIDSFTVLSPSKVRVDGNNINHTYRQTITYIKLNQEIYNSASVDDSRFKFSDYCTTKACECLPLIPCGLKSSIQYYASVKRPLATPYGQIGHQKLIPISCYNNVNVNSLTPFATDSLFNGDVFITKFSYKNHFPLFTDVPTGELDGFEIDYSKYRNIAFPRFWNNSIPVEPYELFNFNPVALLVGGNGDGLIKDRFNLDCATLFSFRDFLGDDKELGSALGDFFDNLKRELGEIFEKRGKFYTAVNGVQEFYVESRYNNDYRNKSNVEEQIHYPHQDWSLMNRIDRNKYDNSFLYDEYLRLQEIHKAVVINTDYDPETCNKEDYRIIYSLKTNTNNVTDNWKIFRPLSYTQLSKQDGELTNIHAIDTNTLMIALSNAMYITQPDDSLITKSGAEVYLGTGDIFERRLQKLSYDETGYLGSVDKYSFLNTRHGTVWLDRLRRKILLYNGKLTEISNEGTNQWLQYHLENIKPNIHKESVISVYDNHFDNIYFTHKKTDESCSWTLSYKPGLGWISFHSFIPQEYFSLANDFLSADTTGVWKHNDVSSFQTYYGKQYPYFFSTVINSKVPSVLQSIEIKNTVTSNNHYTGLTYHQNLFFNKVNIYSSTTNSGLLNVKVKDRNNPYDAISQFGGNCNVTQVENEYYRINGFLNFATSQPTITYKCNGYDFTVSNTNPLLNPRLAGTIRGDWKILTLINDKIFDKKFKTLISVQTEDKIVR